MKAILFLVMMLVAGVGYASIQGATLQGATIQSTDVVVDSFMLMSDGSSFIVLDDGTSKIKLAL